MKRIIFGYWSGETEIIWEIDKWDDYYTLKERNNITGLNGLNQISIPKRILDKIIEDRESEEGK